MALGGAAAVPKQLERGAQRQPPLPPLLMTARLQSQALSFRFAPTLVLTVMGQL
jgi:hypothetical protein